jgi:NADH-quinone oxidoreductase subunit G
VHRLLPRLQHRLETRDGVVVRKRPRSNENVNHFFICDHGRADYRWLNRTDRLEVPAIQGSRGHEAVDWDVALAAAARVLKGKRAYVVASPGLSNEALHLLGRLVLRTGGVGTFRVATGPEAPLAGVDDLALRADRAPNARGAEALGFSRSDAPFAGVAEGDALVMVDVEPDHVDMQAVGRASAVIVLGTIPPTGLAEADVALPICTYAEEEGTFTNLRGRVQRFLQARAAPGLARPTWFVMADLLGAVGGPTSRAARDVFDALAREHAAFRGQSCRPRPARMPMAGAAMPHRERLPRPAGAAPGRRSGRRGVLAWLTATGISSGAPICVRLHDAGGAQALGLDQHATAPTAWDRTASSSRWPTA